MKKTLMLVLAAAIVLMFSSPSHAQTSTLTDIGNLAPTPGPNDVFMTDESAVGGPPGLNYYADGTGPGGNPGEIFTTGNNSSGYTLTSLAVLTDANGGGNITTTPQTWYLRIYSFNRATSNTTLVVTYPSQNNFTFFETDWLQFTNLGAALLPNSQYAYTIQRGTSGWELMGAENTAAIGNGLLTNGVAVLIPTGGGLLTVNAGGTYANNPPNNYPTSPGWVADFDVGLAPITSLVVNAPVTITPGNIYPNPENAYSTNTAVTINCGSVLGTGPFSFHWQTDGGSGGSLTNIPGATASNVVVNASSNPGLYRYDVVVNNNTTSVTSSVVSLRVAYPTVAAALVDEGTNYVSSPYYPSISQLSAGGNGSPDGKNYYDNNSSSPGQTFTTGTNAQGYILTSVQIQTSPTSNQGGIATGQPYYLYIYSVNTNTGVGQIIQSYTNANFTFSLGDWLAWGGLNVALAPNKVYAYAFGDNSGSYAGLNSSTTNNYTGGQLCLISPIDGSINFDGTDPTTNNSGVFYLQFSAVGQPVPQPVASAISASPSSGLVGTTFTLTENASGSAPLTYYWLTDGGNGGTLTNIPGNNVSNLVLNTTSWNPGIYSYKVIVSNSTLVTATSAVVSVPVTVASVSNSAVLTDFGINPPTPGPNDIYQTNEFTGSGGPSGLNYYFDNSSPPGETFTTGNYTNGYVLNTLAIELAGDDQYVSPDFPAGGQGYLVKIYRIYNDQGGQYASLYATYASQTNFVISKGTVAPENDKDWLQMTNIALPLQPGTLYAYSFGKVPSGAGYENLASLQNTSTPDYYPGGQAALLPSSSGQIQYATASGWDGTFDLGLALGTAPVKLTVQNIGAGQIQLKWAQGTLLQSPSVSGPWTTNLNTSPYTFTPAGPQQFYRVRVQ